MLKKLAYLGATLTFAALAVPSLTFAATLSSSQVNSIISLLLAFGADNSTIASVQSALTGTLVQPTTTCVNISQDLTLGATDASTGGAVTELQTFLQHEGYFTYTGPKGYYGFITAQAVGQYQMAKGLVSSSNDSAYGITGPQTRESMQCGSQSDSTFTASETNGTSPITVAFTYRFDVNAEGGAGRQFVVNFGDGTQGSMTVTDAARVSHIYTQPGTYTATVSLVTSSGNEVLTDRYGHILTQTITVTSGQTPNAPTLTAAPVSGQAPLAVSFNVRNITWQPTLDGPPNYYQLVLGDGSIVGLTEGENYCSAGSNASCTFGHTYMSAGTYTATLYAGKVQEGSPIWSVTITVTGSQNQPTAAIDASVLSEPHGPNPVITGSASNTSMVRMSLARTDASSSPAFGASAPVVNGRWSIQIASPALSQQSLPNGTYTLYVYDTSNNLLTTGTLIVTYTCGSSSSGTSC